MDASTPVQHRSANDPLPVTPDMPADAQAAYLPDQRRRGVALCLSGGGSRAALFHLGVIRRLNETGILSQVNTITSVSGGSIFAAHLAAKVANWPAPGDPIPNFETLVVPDFEAFVRRNLRTAPVARRLLPRNWRNDQAQIDALARLFDRYLNGAKLVDLSAANPEFVFCASDNAYAVNWIFTRERIGDYQAGYTSPGGWTVGKAAAASACFPPVFEPMKAAVSPEEMTGGHAPRGAARDRNIRGLRLSDGGLYDNLGLEPVWKSHAIVIVSDGGSTFDAAGDEGLFKRLKRYATVMGRQTTALRKRWLISSFGTGVMTGTYMGIGTPVARYGPGYPGYPTQLVEEVISEVRTDLDEFSDAEICVLQNQGYLVANAAISKHLSLTTLSIKQAPLAIPYPDWMDETEVRAGLAESSKVKLPFGRGSWLEYLR